MQVLLLVGNGELLEQLEKVLRQRYVTMIAYDAPSALEVLRCAHESGLVPDLVVLSTHAGEIDPPQLAQKISQQWLIPVIFLNPMGPSQVRAEALLTHADDFITEPTFNVGDLLVRVERVLGRLHPTGTPTAREGLTRRQRQILPLLADGLTDNEIARVLGLTERTIKHHIQEAGRRLDASGRAHLVSIALRQRLIPYDPPEGEA